MSPRTKLELAAACLALAAIWYASLPDKAPTNQTSHAAPAPELKDKKKTTIAPPRVPAYDSSAKTDLGLPADVADDQNKYVLGSAKLPSDTHPHTVTTVMDKETGETVIYDRRDPLPWFAAEQTGYLRLSHGVRTDIGGITRLAASASLVSIKAMRFGFDGSIDSDGQAYIGAHVEYRW